mmetsp:Transcript_3844/g.8699  ORF Transcript_3844/g.8699 Transcript_3844/m.8699 type:complete len:221 (+) Transcript_3844:1087-1749(+)
MLLHNFKHYTFVTAEHLICDQETTGVVLHCLHHYFLVSPQLLAGMCQCLLARFHCFDDDLLVGAEFLTRIDQGMAILLHSFQDDVPIGPKFLAGILESNAVFLQSLPNYLWVGSELFTNALHNRKDVGAIVVVANNLQDEIFVAANAISGKSHCRTVLLAGCACYFGVAAHAVAEELEEFPACLDCCQGSFLISEQLWAGPAFHHPHELLLPCYSALLLF